VKPYAPAVGFILIAAVSLATASTFHVDLNGAGDFLTIQEGVDAAQSIGDTVLVAPGVYTGSGNREIDLQGKNLLLKSVGGADVTIIDCEYAGRGFYFHSAEFWYTVVQGFTVTNGSRYEGGAVWMQNSSPAIWDCIFDGNSANFGGAMHVGIGAAPNIENCIFRNNVAEDYGGAIYSYQGQPYVLESQFIDNEAGINGGGMSIKASSSVRLLYCEFEGNTAQDGGGIYVGMLGSPGGEGFIPTIISFCTFTENEATRGGALFSNSFALVSFAFCTVIRNTAVQGGGLYSHTDYSGFFDVQNCTLAWNSAHNGGGLCCAGDPDYNMTTISTSIIAFSDSGNALHRLGSTPITAIFNVTFGNAGGDQLFGNNLVVDPLFCDGPGDDYNLCEDSMCRGNNNEWGILIGSHRQICGPCGTPVEHATWGAIKGRYR